MKSTTMFLGGLAIGIVGLGAARYAAMPPAETDEPIHYHANLVVYLDGERVRFQDELYMQDLASCRLDPTMLSTYDRVHFHQMIDDVVHTHDSGVAWGHFFSNLGYTVGDDVVVDDEGERFVDGDGQELVFVLNGSGVPSIANREIRSLDRLLVHHGPADVDPALIDARFDEVPDNAQAFNESHQDGLGCTSGEEHEEETALTRLRRAFWF
ncbi:MAG: hypothetical protein ABFS34_02510 [Gemmatimonadota bacterium]